MKTACVLATRNRPDHFERCVAAVKETSGADVVAYVDEDQRAMYAFMEGVDGVRLLYGDRLGQCGSLNVMTKTCDTYDVYQMITDDMIITTPGWEEHAEKFWKESPNGVFAASPKHTYGGHFDIPMVSRAWLDAVGFFAVPGLYMNYWHVAVHVISEAAGVVRWFEKDQMFITHHQQKRDPLGNMTIPADEHRFARWMSYDYVDAIERLRAACEGREPVAGLHNPDFSGWLGSEHE